MAELPTHNILSAGRRFLRLKVEQRHEIDRDEFRVVLEGDAATKVLLDWQNSREAAIAAYDAERAIYR